MNNNKPKSRSARLSCPVAKVATILADTWTILIIRDLAQKARRYNELLESLHNISTRTLVLKLQRLEALNILAKKGWYYGLTAKGKRLGAIFQEMRKYGEKYL